MNDLTPPSHAAGPALTRRRLGAGLLAHSALGMAPFTTPAALAKLAGIAGAASLAGCAGPELSDYAGQQPVLDMRRYFNGPLRGHGWVTDRGGKPLRRFVVDIVGQWRGDAGTLDESFVYDDGERQHRLWRLQVLPDGRYEGRADDVVGVARGTATGPALQWQYTLRLPVRGEVYEVAFDDWMVLVDDRTLLNRAVMSKFGLRVGEIFMAFHKP